MRILARGINGSLILEAGADEVANLIGFYYNGPEASAKLQPGNEIRVAEMFHQLYSLSKNKGEADKYAATLRAIADLLQVKNPLREFDYSDPSRPVLKKES